MRLSESLKVLQDMVELLLVLDVLVFITMLLDNSGLVKYNK